jgi:hypothetical protein
MERGSSNACETSRNERGEKKRSKELHFQLSMAWKAERMTHIVRRVVNCRHICKTNTSYQEQA